MPNFFIIRLGKDSVSDIKRIDSLRKPPDKPFKLDVVCKQVPAEFTTGDYALLWFGSDNNKGSETEWKQGLRAFAFVIGKEGAPGYNEEQKLTLNVTVIFPTSIDKKDLLSKAPAAYYWFSDIPVVGLSASSNQTTQQIDPGRPQEDIRALFYAIEAVHPGFRASIERLHSELSGLFNYTPPAPTSGVSEVPPRHESAHSTEEASTDTPKLLAATWILALASKGFVLISGPSGTGKSRTARDIARALDYSLPAEYSATALACRPANCLAFVPVGADWTDDTPLIGFRNFFGPVRKEGTAVSHETWEPPATLRLLLRAIQYPDQPHFLVLDEMNLSHVERYFSQFISLLESNRGLSSSSKLPLLDVGDLRLVGDTLKASNEHPLEMAVAERLAGSGQPLSIPDNLFIIGTVNVDETTYMFSPKVLDRAHVLEMSAPDPSAYLNGEDEDSGFIMPTELASKLLTRAAERRRNGFWERERPEIILKEVAADGPFAEQIDEIFGDIKAVLSGLQSLLTPVGYAFAYRTINEVCAYMATYIECGDPALLSRGSIPGVRNALDCCIVQKVLPKIHGNRRQLGESLKAVHKFLIGEKAEYLIGGLRVQTSGETVLRFGLPVSARKVQSMIHRLEATGHTTFVI